MVGFDELVRIMVTSDIDDLEIRLRGGEEALQLVGAGEGRFA
jgi:hypothetical protein